MISLKMVITLNNDISKLINKYFSIHLRQERRFSDNTYLSYLNVINQYLVFLEKNKNISRINLTINDFSKDNIVEYLNHIIELGLTSKTRNHHLSALKSFLEYVQSTNSIYINTYLDVKCIKKAKCQEKVIDFLTIEELEAVLKECNLGKKSEYKHFMILSILYETGCRVSELINIKYNDIHFGTNSYIKVLGKENKERLIYISKNTEDLLNNYIEKFEIKSGYLFLNHSNRMYSRFGINKIVKKYVDKASKKLDNLREKNITPHGFRHSKAVHFLLNGTALPIIQKFLGHSQIQTTEKYLAVTSDITIEAVEEVSKNINYLPDDKAIWKGDQDLLNLLASLK